MTAEPHPDPRETDRELADPGQAFAPLDAERAAFDRTVARHAVRHPGPALGLPIRPYGLPYLR